MSKAGSAEQTGGRSLSLGPAGASSLMPLSVVQGDHMEDAEAEEESLPPSRASRKSTTALPPGLRA